MLTPIASMAAPPGEGQPTNLTPPAPSPEGRGGDDDEHSGGRRGVDNSPSPEGRGGWGVGGRGCITGSGENLPLSLQERGLGGEVGGAVVLYTVAGIRPYHTAQPP